MHYLNSIIWFLTWPLLIWLCYRMSWYMINRYEKKGMFRVEEKEDFIKE